MAGGHVEGMCMARGVCMGGVHVGGHVCMVGGGDMHGRGAYKVGGMHDMHPPGKILQLHHMVNEQAVRILLECILVMC